MSPPPAHLYIDPTGATWRVWDLLDEHRVAAAAHVVERRLFVGDADGWAFTCGVNPRACPFPVSAEYLAWQLARALEADPVRGRGEEDAAYAARCATHRAAHRAAQQAEQHRIWDAVRAACRAQGIPLMGDLPRPA